MNQTLAALTQRNVDTIAKIEAASLAQRTRGERISHAIAIGPGSWTFLVVQAGLLLLWMIANVLSRIRHWEPYPFVFLNLALSFQSAFAVPIIMMSQNRQSRASEQRNQLDLQINLLAEQENTEMHRLLTLLCSKSGIPLVQLTSTKMLSEETQPDALIQQITRTASNPTPGTPP